MTPVPDTPLPKRKTHQHQAYAAASNFLVANRLMYSWRLHLRKMLCMRSVVSMQPCSLPNITLTAL